MKGISYLFITLISLALFMPFLGAVHLFDWDEINFAEAAREMLVTGNFSTVTINYEPFWEKPPLFIWMQAWSMQLFGVNAFAARFPTVLSAIATLNLIYFIGIKHFRPSLAQWWVLVYLGSLAPHFYFKTGLIDPTFNLFIFWSIYQLACAYSAYQNGDNNKRHLILSALFIGVAVLVKGPVAIVIYVLMLLLLTVFNRKPFYTLGSFLIGAIIVFAVVSIWFLPETIKNGPWFIQRFLVYQVELFSQNVAGHQQPWFYHPLVLFFACFPATALAIAAMSMPVERHREKPFFKTFNLLFWVVLILFSMVKTKIVHYSSLCWLPLTFLAAYWLDYAIGEGKRLKIPYKILAVLSALPVIIVQIASPFILSKIGLQSIADVVKDDFAKAIITTPVNLPQWQIYLVCLMGVGLLVILFWSLFNVQKLPVLFFYGILNGMILSAVLVPIIDQKLQAPLFNFYKQIAKKDAYVETMHFKSYAHYFYARVKPLNKNAALNLLNKSFLGNKSIQNLSQDSFNLLKDLQRGFYRDAPRDKPIYLIYKSNYTPLPTAEEGFYSLGNYGAYAVFLRPKGN